MVWKMLDACNFSQHHQAVTTTLYLLQCRQVNCFVQRALGLIAITHKALQQSHVHKRQEGL